MPKKKGFTLIELLVVIAIIALLLAILMPSLRKAKQVARDVVCRSNLRQWGLIWKIYTDDNDGKFPGMKDSDNDGKYDGAKRGHWIDPLRNEWKARDKILLCPTAQKDNPNDKTYGMVDATYAMKDEGDPMVDDGEKCSYGINVWCMNTKKDIQNRLVKDHWQTINMTGSSQIPLFADSLWRSGGPNYYNTGKYAGRIGCQPADENGFEMPNPSNGSRRYEMSHFAMDRHNGGINMLMVDMSVSHVNIKDLWKLKWHRSFDTRGYREVTDKDWPEWMKTYPE